MILSQIDNSGKVGFNFYHRDRKGARVSRDFIEKLFVNMVKKSTIYFDETDNDHIFTYREKQLHTVICPSIEMITPRFVIELPITRKPAGDEEYQGNVDYWISYRNYTFLLELKHTFFAYKNPGQPHRYIRSKFKDAKKQLENIRIKECRRLADNKGTIKIALEVIVFYETSKKEISNIESDDYTYSNLLDNMIKNAELENEISFSAIWELDHRLTEPFEFENINERFPAVGCIGYISKKF